MESDTDVIQPKTCLIAGGSGRLGGAIALALASRGRTVGIHYNTRRDEAERTAKRARDGGAEAFLLQADITSKTSATRLVDEFAERAGSPPTELVVAQGLTRHEPLLRTPEKNWDDIINVNLAGAAWLLQAACSHWTTGTGGHAVLLGSYAASAGRSGEAAYAASKAALVGLVRSVAIELGTKGVRANVVVPPFVKEGMGATASKEFVEAAERTSVSRRTGSAEEFARFVADVLDSDGISGQVLSADTRIA